MHMSTVWQISTRPFLLVVRTAKTPTRSAKHDNCRPPTHHLSKPTPLSPLPLSILPAGRLRHVLVPQRLRLVHPVHGRGVNPRPMLETLDGILETLPMGLNAQVHLREHLPQSVRQPLDSHLGKRQKKRRVSGISLCTPARRAARSGARRLNRAVKEGGRRASINDSRRRAACTDKRRRSLTHLT